MGKGLVQKIQAKTCFTGTVHTADPPQNLKLFDNRPSQFGPCFCEKSSRKIVSLEKALLSLSNDVLQSINTYHQTS